MLFCLLVSRPTFERDNHCAHTAAVFCSFIKRPVSIDRSAYDGALQCNDSQQKSGLLPMYTIDLSRETDRRWLRDRRDRRAVSRYIRTSSIKRRVDASKRTKRSDREKRRTEREWGSRGTGRGHHKMASGQGQWCKVTHRPLKFKMSMT